VRLQVGGEVPIQGPVVCAFERRTPDRTGLRGLPSENADLKPQTHSAGVPALLQVERVKYEVADCPPFYVAGVHSL
jgi:hypothetical protein